MHSSLQSRNRHQDSTVDEQPTRCAMTAIALPELTEREHQVQLRRAVIASTVGTAIEW
jgi:hypothetical protein